MLARGKLHFEILGESFQDETPEAAATLVAKFQSALKVRFRMLRRSQRSFSQMGAVGFISKQWKHHE